MGAAVAERLGWEFLDFDREIERRTGRTIPQIFDGPGGEGEFRRLEAELTRELTRGPARVLAPGGGWVEQPSLMALLRPPSRIIYLAASPAAALRRMGRGWSRRPLLAGGDAGPRLEALLLRRRSAYELADLVIDTEVVDFLGIVRSVSALAPPSGED